MAGRGFLNRFGGLGDVSVIWRVTALLFLNFIDWFSSILNSGYAREGNPLMVAIVDQPLVALVLKMVITLLSCSMLAYAYKRGPRRYAEIGFYVLILFYGVVVVNNLLLYFSSGSII